jgi:transcriptional regulator with XRE-family HTH domain
MSGKRIEVGPLAQQVARNVRRLREQRKLSFTDLSRELAEVGRAIPLLGIRRIETYERRVDVDELAAIAQVFGVTNPWDLVSTPDCKICSNAPPAGFRCVTCDRSGPDTPTR